MCDTRKFYGKFKKLTLFGDEPPLYAHFSLISSHLLLGIRIIAILYLTGFFIYDLFQTHSLMDKITHITNISYFFTWLYFLTVV